mgnify:CR=1 FL=1
MRKLMLGASAIALATLTGQDAMAQSDALSKAVGGYTFEDAVKEAPGTKDFHSKDGKLTFAIVTHTAGNGFFDPVYVGAKLAAATGSDGRYAAAVTADNELVVLDRGDARTIEALRASVRALMGHLRALTVTQQIAQPARARTGQTCAPRYGAHAFTCCVSTCRP